MKQSELIQKLIKISEDLNTEAKHIEELSFDELTHRPKEGAWNAFECFEHLNTYIDIYNNFFDESFRKTKPVIEDREIKRGYFGNMFINMMEPKEEGIKKMNTFKSKNPIGKQLTKDVIQHFIRSNSRTIDYLEEAKTKDIQNVKCRLAIPLLKLKLADSMHFIVAHNQRHMLQIKRAVKL